MEGRRLLPLFIYGAQVGRSRCHPHAENHTSYLASGRPATHGLQNLCPETEARYPAWIRTMTKGFKDPCATVTPRGNRPRRSAWRAGKTTNPRGLRNPKKAFRTQCGNLRSIRDLTRSGSARSDAGRSELEPRHGAFFRDDLTVKLGLIGPL
jgi:hypothetical protein